MKNNTIQTFDYKIEVLRKSIHLCSLSIPIGYYFIDKGLALMLLIPVAIFSIVVDLGRYKFDTLSGVFYKIFGFMLREHEKDHKKKNLNGATYVLLSAVLVILVFPKVFVITAFTILIISDISAALVGRKIGKTRFLMKSLEGTTAFFVSACIVIMVTPKINYSFSEYLIGFVAAFVGAIAENISFGWADDNFTIPLSVCVIMWILYSVILPGLDVYKF